MTVPRVLIFDSGIGGLSIAGCIHQALPSVSITYLADSAGFPYGAQSETVVIERSRALITEALRQWPSDVVVVACNTASTVVLPQLRAMTQIPVIGVVPAIKPAAALSRNRRIGVLATPATVTRPYLAELVEAFASDCEVERIGHPELVRWIEDQVEGRALPSRALNDALQPFREKAVDTVVLGCTHYPLILPLLQSLLPGVRHWVDSGAAIARRVAWLLSESGVSPGVLTQPAGAVALERVLFTGAIPGGLKKYMADLGLPAGQCEGHWPAGADSDQARQPEHGEELQRRN